MNVPSPEWASFFPTRQPLSSGLRAVFRSDAKLPAEIEVLLLRLERRPSERRADND